MSSTASFFRVPRSELHVGRGMADLLDQATELGDEYDYSGYVMLNLLTALEEIGVSFGADLTDAIEQSESTGAVFFATRADLPAIEALDLNQLDDESVGDGLELDDEELREAVVDSVTLLHQLIAATAPDEVLVIRIG